MGDKPKPGAYGEASSDGAGIVATPTTTATARATATTTSTAIAIATDKSNSDGIDWLQFSQWIHCFCVVTFDLNLGQALEYVYPPEFMPSEQEVSNICYMAFPDSNSGCMGDTKFHMRLRALSNGKYKMQQSVRNYNYDCAPALRSDSSHYWGFVYFRQQRNANLPRGYFQKSFIIITRLPFFNLYYDILSQLAPRYFAEGNEIIQMASTQINTQWPLLQAGQSLLLTLLESSYRIIIPSKSSSSRKTTTTHSTPLVQSSENGSTTTTSMTPPLAMRMPTKIIQSVNEIELFHSLGFVVDSLYTLWELVITAEPIVVVGTSPAICSHMVQTLVALIAPLEYCAEARPYFTIHDTEFKEFTQQENASKAPPAVILGVTNPFFVKLLKEWPHMLRLVDNQKQFQQQQLLQQNATINATSYTTTSSSTHPHGGGGGGRSLKLSHQGVLNHNILNSGITAGGDNSGLAGLHTKYKPFLKKDKALIKKVMLGVKTKRPDSVQTALIRRNLLELTQSFMIPLERYVASLMPLQKDISPFKSAPNANSFKLDDFLATLEASGPHLTSPLKGDWKGLYRRFFKSSNFRGWYESRHRELQLTLQELQLQALSEANLEHWAHDKQEVEIIDMILKLKQKLNLYSDKSQLEGNTNSSSSSTQDQIRAQIECMKGLLPPDLKNVVNL